MKTITILELDNYNGKTSDIQSLYFVSEDDAIQWLTDKGYKKDKIFEWKLDYSNTAEIHIKPLLP